MTGALLFSFFFFFFLRSRPSSRSRRLRSRSRRSSRRSRLRLRLRLRLRPLTFFAQPRQTRHLTSSSFFSPCSTYSKGSSKLRRPSVDAHPRAAHIRSPLPLVTSAAVRQRSPTAPSRHRDRSQIAYSLCSAS